MLVVHHTGWDNQNRPRGSVDWRAGVAIELDVSDGDHDDQKRISWGKVREGEEAAPFLVDFNFQPDAVRLTFAGSTEPDEAGPFIRQTLLGRGQEGILRQELIKDLQTHEIASSGRTAQRLATRHLGRMFTRGEAAKEGSRPTRYWAAEFAPEGAKRRRTREQ